MKRSLLLLPLLTLACAFTSTVSSQAPFAKLAKTTPSTATPTTHGIALGQVNIRTCPSAATSDECKVIGYYQYGAKVKISGDVIFTSSTDCNRWYPVTWREQTAYVCAAWVSK